MKSFWFLITITFSFDLINVIRRGDCYMNALDEARYVANSVFIFTEKYEVPLLALRIFILFLSRNYSLIPCYSKLLLFIVIRRIKHKCFLIMINPKRNPWLIFPEFELQCVTVIWSFSMAIILLSFILTRKFREKTNQCKEEQIQNAVQNMKSLNDFQNTLQVLNLRIEKERYRVCSEAKEKYIPNGLIGSIPKNWNCTFDESESKFN